MAMAMGTCRCSPEAERHSAAAATGAVATGAVAIGAVQIGAAVTNSSLPVDLVFRITATVLTPTVTTTSPLTDTATTAIKGTVTTAPKGTAMATKGTATAPAAKGIATAITGYGNSDRYRGGPIDGISTEAFRDGRKGYCRIDTANLRLRHEGKIEKI